MTYATAPEADEVAVDIGDSSFVDYDAKSSCLADGAVSATATLIAFDSLANPGAIQQYGILQHDTELMRVESVTYNTPAQIDGVVTVTRGAYGTIAAAIPDDATIKVKTLAKVRLLDVATRDIIAYHKQVLPGGNVWYSGSAELKRACALQAIYLSHYIDARQTAEYIRNVSSGNYSDTVLTVGGGAERQLDRDAKQLVDYVLEYAGVASGEFQRA